MSTKKSIEELAQSYRLIQAEREAEIEQYEELLKRASVTERREKGLTWYPIVITDEEIGIGEQLVATIERTTQQETPHKFRQGQTVVLFNHTVTTGNSKARPYVNGIVQKVRRNTLQITLHINELPDWAYEGKLGVDVLYNETTFKEMEFALKKLMDAKSDRLAALRDILLGYGKPSFQYGKYAPNFPQLNESQNKAVQQITTAEDIAIVHGPPGTGKTTTLIRAIQQTLKTEKQVLVCAPSNTAVDLLVAKLLEKGVKVVRIGHMARIDNRLLDASLDAQIATHRDYKQMKQYRKDAQQQRAQALKFKRNFGREEREERRAALKDVRELLDYAKEMERFILQDVLNSTQVIAATLVGASHFTLRKRQFSTAFIDEAAQALEPATWIPIIRANRVVLAGDHCQLPPTVKSVVAQKGGLEVSLFEKCINRLSVDTMLEVQYRMNEQIMQFSSEVFYDNRLQAAEAVKHWTLGKADSDELLTMPLNFIDTAGCGYEETRNQKSLSLLNKQEANLLYKYLSMVLEQFENEGVSSIEELTVGIIAPYKEQVLYLESIVADYAILEKHKARLSINTVDGFQGQERDIIAISLVRSNQQGDIGFLSDIRRMNVAMTRAKKKLIVVGDSATLANHPFYQQFLSYTERTEAYKSAWEFMY